MNPYKVLGVERTATVKQIKKAYKKLATKYHPDRPGGDVERFKDIKKAYEILMDKEARLYFDEHGEIQNQQKPSTIYELAIIKVMNHVASWIAISNVQADLVSHIIQNLNKEMNALKIEIQKGNQGIIQIEVARDRLKCDSDDDVIGGFLDKKLDDISEFFERSDKETNVINKAIEIMKHYDWKAQIMLPTRSYFL